MSFILDALRKSELERQRQSGPSVAELPIARDDRRLPIALVAIGVLLAVNVAVLLYFLMRDGREPAVPVAEVAATSAALPPAPQPATSRAPAPAADAAGVTLADMATQAPAARLPDARDPTLLPDAPASDSGNVDYYDEPPAPAQTLPSADAAGLPALAIDLHIYTDDPAKRAVFINGRRYAEGATLAEGPEVEQITPDGVVLRHRGQRFQLSRH